jgi:hypothetical protein
LKVVVAAFENVLSMPAELNADQAIGRRLLLQDLPDRQDRDRLPILENA